VGWVVDGTKFNILTSQSRWLRNCAWETLILGSRRRKLWHETCCVAGNVHSLGSIDDTGSEFTEWRDIVVRPCESVYSSGIPWVGSGCVLETIKMRHRRRNWGWNAGRLGQSWLVTRLDLWHGAPSLVFGLPGDAKFFWDHKCGRSLKDQYGKTSGKASNYLRKAVVSGTPRRLYSMITNKQTPRRRTVLITGQGLGVKDLWNDDGSLALASTPS
jgi:hypothetical protein